LCERAQIFPGKSRACGIRNKATRIHQVGRWCCCAVVGNRGRLDLLLLEAEWSLMGSRAQYVAAWLADWALRLLFICGGAEKSAARTV